MQTTPVVSIVDDDRAVRSALASLVRSLGLDAHLFASAEAFLASGEASVTACLVSDIRMPGMSGVELQEQLIADGVNPPTIFITAYATPAVAAKTATNGALVLLPKPFLARDMTHWLSVAIGMPLPG